MKQQTGYVHCATTLATIIDFKENKFDILEDSVLTVKTLFGNTCPIEILAFLRKKNMYFFKMPYIKIYVCVCVCVINVF